MEGITWQGRKLNLRPVQVSDVAFFQQFDETASFYLDATPWPKNEVEVQRWIAREMARKFGDASRWVAEDEHGETVGTIHTFACERYHGTFKYGLAVLAPFQRQGYAMTMIQLILTHYFNTLTYQKATPYVYSCNLPSIQLHEKMSFVKEGQLRNMLRIEDRYYDEIHYGITADEFRLNHRK